MIVVFVKGRLATTTGSQLGLMMGDLEMEIYAGRRLLNTKSGHI